MFTNFRIKVHDFFVRNKRKIFLIVIAWVILIIVNYWIKNTTKIEPPKTTYQPHTSIMDSNSEVPEKLQQPISQTIDRFVGYCNNKEYENAYSMLSPECKKELYPTIDPFKEYVDRIYTSKKIYTIQNYSNVNKTYIYEVKILDDILASGLTGKEELEYYKEKFVIKEYNDKLSLSIGQYIGETTQDIVYEDENMKIKIKDKVSTYETEKYKLEITNKTDYIIVLSDYKESNEILLDLEKDKRIPKKNFAKPVIISQNSTQSFELEFTKFYDETQKSLGIIFDKVRILKSYSSNEENYQKELEEAIAKYSFEIKF